MDGVLNDVVFHIPKLIPPYCDNKAAHYLAHDPASLERKKTLESELS